MAITTNVTGFQKLLMEAENDGIKLDNSAESMAWLKQKYIEISPRDVLPREFIRDQNRYRRVPLIGRLYMFLYNPKYRYELPYYDRFPLVFPIRRVAGGFYGLNIHYLAPRYRALLMDSLYDTISDTKFDETTRLKINYDILSAASKYRWFRPCVKHYLTPHLSSQLLYIDPKEWNLALFVPSEQFRGANKRDVWQDSKEMF
jgi:hypothetical protein